MGGVVQSDSSCRRPLEAREVTQRYLRGTETISGPHNKGTAELEVRVSGKPETQECCVFDPAPLSIYYDALFILTYWCFKWQN